MQATEFRIGNLLNYTTAEGDVLTNVIDWHDLKWLSEDEQGFNLVHNPIPLTEEWLVKMDFSYINNINFYSYYINDSFVIMYGYNNFHFSPSLNIAIGQKIEYVHQLQNLYYCICGEELILLK